MSPLEPSQRRALRAKAHHLHPIVIIGNQGLTPAVLHEIDGSLMAHELVKLRVFNDDRAERDALLQRICAELDALPVQHLGKILVVYRAKPALEPAEAAPPARKKRTPAPAGKPPVRGIRATRTGREATAMAFDPKQDSRTSTSRRSHKAVIEPPAPEFENGGRGRALASKRTPKKSAAGKSFAAPKSGGKTLDASHRGRPAVVPAGPRPPRQRRRRG